MATITDRASLAWEGSYPAMSAIACGVGALAFAPAAFRAMIDHEWQIGNIYSSVFDVSAIFTAFLFTFYAFVVTPERGFIGRAKASIYYRQMVRYTLAALSLGGLLTDASVPMMVIEPTPIQAGGLDYYAVAVWFALAGWTIASFIRAATIFSIFASQHS